MPLNIVIDGNEANTKNRVGSNVYAFEVLRGLNALTRRRKDTNITVLLSSAPVADLPNERSNWIYKVVRPSFFSTQLAIPLYLFWHQKKYDVFFTPGHYAPKHCPIPYVSSVMDLAFLDFPEQFKKKDYLQLKEWTRYSVKNAAKIIVISESTKVDVVEKYGRDPEDVVVAYPAVDQVQLKIDATRIKNPRRKYRLNENYLLFVGTLQPRKNLIRLIDAFEKLMRKIEVEAAPHARGRGQRGRKKLLFELTGLQLVIAGKTGWLAGPILERIKKSPFRKNIILTGYISSVEKASLIMHARALILVGLYEGFGIPALEAMVLGTTPVVSNVSSLPEVVDGGGLLVDPENEDGIYQGLREVLTLSASERAVLAKNARRHTKSFSWHQTAKRVFRTLEHVAAKNKKS